MTMVINTNSSSINGQKNVGNSNASLSTAMERLSSGLRINNAKDDAAGLAIANRMTSQIRGMGVAVRNANDGMSLTQTAEGALGSLTDTLQRMRDLAIQSSSNAGVSATDREKLQTEYKALNSELTRITQNSEFNGKKILNGDLAGGLSIQVGDGVNSTNQILVSISNMNTLLAPVSGTSLNPKNESVDATFYAATVANASNTIAANPDLQNANAAAALANVAVKAATLAVASPGDLALAQAAAKANLDAANAIASSASTVLNTTITNKGLSLVSDAFVATVTTENASNASVAVTQAAIPSITTTDSAQARAFLTTANQLATAATENIAFMGKNVYESTMNAITGDSLAVTDSSTIGVSSTLNSAIAIAEKGTFKADRIAQKAMSAVDIAKSVASASYVNDPTATQSENTVNKQTFINDNNIVVDTSTKTDSVATNYALSAVDAIDKAIAAVDTERSNLGSTQNRFTSTVSNLQNGVENQTAAKSRIIDADFAIETANLSRAQILQQAGTAMLAQANQSGQGVLTLLK